jgi:ketosteroid isomerase-like protein
VETSEEAAVLSANQAFYDAFVALDLDAMEGVWSEVAPVSCVHPGWEPLVGRRAVLDSWRGIFEGSARIGLVVRDVRALVAGTTAWVVLTEQIEERHGARAVRAAALATNVFVREAGAWKLVHHHAAPAQVTEEGESGDGGGMLN